MKISTSILRYACLTRESTFNEYSISRIYNTTIYPNNLPVLANGSTATPEGLFSVNATGRISPLGNFTGFDDSTEYFFALSPIPGQTGPGILQPNYNAFTSYELHAFTSGCPEVASTIAYLNTTIVNPGSPSHGKYVTKIKEIAFWRFDDTGAVLYYDAQIPNLSLWFAKFTGADISNVAVQTLDIVTNLCPQIQARCTGANQVYSSELECIATLLAKPFGTFDETWGDNIVCRLVHVVLTQVRPEIHCPHVGPTGGMKCVDYDYNQGYLADDLALFGSNDAFRCPGE
ncbi:uncharacterized protein EAE97_008239 [Botrytis byssoidea]|uniref:Uncharacterized protein n=1 Tax=Botrytis byssoidea TaxID=139641 RepID=A0A9P5I9B1_9HELO|nr:uncharacterized protein EAE97_008239 [Botrytis byssoidea]KAF7935332.1 hypothetical protein EAE97_008239 [Botrytis byssoidea]